MPEDYFMVMRNVHVGAQRTSVRLEPLTWECLRDICRREDIGLNRLVTLTAAALPPTQSLSSGLRMLALRYFRNAASEDGHRRAGHGVGARLITATLFAQSAHEAAVVGRNDAGVHGLQHGADAI